MDNFVLKHFFVSTLPPCQAGWKLKYDFCLDSEEIHVQKTHWQDFILHLIPTPQRTNSFSKSPTLMNYVQELFFEQDSKGNVLTETSTLMVFNEWIALYSISYAILIFQISLYSWIIAMVLSY